ncbi:hypothetical protein OF83DRAFT_1059914, partial [Amylostereum chailletii]
DIKKATRILHDHGFVFGNLRHPNILVLPETLGAMLIDFEWAGKEGQARYPRYINMVANINWAPTVEGLGLNEREHDIHMLERL